MLGKGPIMLPFAKWCAGAISGLAVVLSFAGRGKKDLSPPPVNASPREKLELVVRMISVVDRFL